MIRSTQQEEELYQQGKRDAFHGRSENSDNPFYRSGWEAGQFERFIKGGFNGANSMPLLPA